MYYVLIVGWRMEMRKQKIKYGGHATKNIKRRVHSGKVLNFTHQSLRVLLCFAKYLLYTLDSSPPLQLLQSANSGSEPIYTAAR